MKVPLSPDIYIRSGTESWKCIDVYIRASLSGKGKKRNFMAKKLKQFSEIRRRIMTLL